MAKQQRRNEEDDDADGLTDRQRQEITDMIGSTVSGLVKRKLPGIVKDAITPAMAELRDMIGGKRGGGGREDDEGDEEDDDPDPDERQDRRRQPQRETARSGRDRGDREDRGRDRGAQRPVGRRGREADREDEPEADRGRRGGNESTELARVRAKLNRLETDAVRERETARNTVRDSSLRELLQAGGVDKNRVRGAVALLRDLTKFDDKANAWVFVGDEEDLDFDAGVKAWLETDEGKAFRGPPGVGGGGAGAGTGAPQLRRSGAGTRAPGGAGRGGSSNPAADARGAKQARLQAAQNVLSEAVDQLVTNAVPIG